MADLVFRQWETPPALKICPNWLVEQPSRARSIQLEVNYRFEWSEPLNRERDPIVDVGRDLGEDNLR